MITYVAYIEDDEKKLGDFEFLLQAYVDKGMVEISRWEEKEPGKLHSLIHAFLSRYINKEWQLIVVDGSILYDVRNPYENNELLQKIEQVLGCGQDSLPMPERIYLLSQRGILEPACTVKEGLVYDYDVPFNFLKEYNSLYRFLVLNIPERELHERRMFRMMCGALIIVANEWALELIERNYLYILSWDIEEQELDACLGRRQCELKVIRERLKGELANYQKNEGGSSLPVYRNHIAELEKSKEVKKMKKEPLGLFANPGEQEVVLWKLNNYKPLDELEGLVKTPVKRWEREITESKNNMLEDLRAIDSQKIALSAEAFGELKKMNEKAAEDIFSTELGEKEQKELIKKIRQEIEVMETLIVTRMTKYSFSKSLFELFAGIIVIGALCFGVGEIEEPSAKVYAGVMVLVVMTGMVLTQVYLWQHRSFVVKKINRGIEKLNRSLWRDNSKYDFLVDKIISHKKYSMLEQQQKNIEKLAEQRRKTLGRHWDKLLQSERDIRKLAIAMGKKPDTDKIYSIAGIDFGREPEECPYYYLPHDSKMIEDIMVKTGEKTRLPFPFIQRFRVKQERPDTIIR